ncbi:MAG TPA: hypothetical protein VKT22_16625 [Steroidobacteraceae bacterium]|nr:hypothetical protein [Steroidobacteraceae bacterium]
MADDERAVGRAAAARAVESIGPAPAQSEDWSRLAECLGVTLWTSFIASCLETGLIFACFDPLTLGSAMGLDVYVAPSVLALRPAIYALGFFVFWLFTFVAASLTAYMLSSGPHES